MNIQTFTHEGRTFTYTNHEISIPRSATNQMLDIVKRWQKVYPDEATYAKRMYGIPSIIVRFDGILNIEGGFDSYELQSGCGWIGYAALANTAFREIRDDFIKNKWPPFDLLAPPQPLFNPDELLWLKRIDMDEALASEGLLWVRYTLGHMQHLQPEERERIVSRSMKPVGTQNSKRYGTYLNWWKEVMWDPKSRGASLPWEEAFVLKPNQTFGSKDIMLWTPQERRGRATRTQIEEVLERRGTMFLQPFIHPMRVDIDGREYNVILRPFFGYDPQKKQWVPMHGVWTGRPAPNLRIHGASDAISGPLMLET
jgi:hypothetical protein